MSNYNLANGWNLFRTENDTFVEKGKTVVVLRVATEGTSERGWSTLKLSFLYLHWLLDSRIRIGQKAGKVPIESFRRCCWLISYCQQAPRTRS